jgi:hypothetical protein
MWVTKMNIVLRTLLALDQGACLIITGQNDFTLSGWAYLRAVNDDKTTFMRLIDKLFFWQPEHCKHAFIWEMSEARKLAAKYIKEYKNLLRQGEY